MKTESIFTTEVTEQVTSTVDMSFEATPKRDHFTVNIGKDGQGFSVRLKSREDLQKFLERLGSVCTALAREVNNLELVENIVNEANNLYSAAKKEAGVKGPDLIRPGFPGTKAISIRNFNATPLLGESKE